MTQAESLMDAPLGLLKSLIKEHLRKSHLIFKSKDI